MNAPDLIRLLEGAGATGPGLEAVRGEIERWQASAARERRWVDAVVDASPHGITVCGLDGRVILENPAAERIWAGSATVGSVAEWGLKRAFHPDGRPYEAQDWWMARCLARGQSLPAEEVRIQRFDGSFATLLASCAPLTDPDGRLEGAVSIFADMTTLRSPEARLARSADALPVVVSMERAQERLIGELTRTVKMNEWFIGVLGHDLRNPLGAILMSATVLSRKLTDDGVGRTVRRILSAGERMNRMIAQLVDFARVRASGGLAIEPRRGDVAAIFRQAVDQAIATLPDREVRFEHHGDTFGFWDVERLGQVAANLVGNAARHGAPDRAAEVRIVGTDAARVSIVVRNGGAIPDDLLPCVFEPFQNVDVRARRAALGLGLYITKEIVASHRGTLTVESASDVTTFTVTLPRGLAPGARVVS